jgi:GT2 family glycosyltransferase
MTQTERVSIIVLNWNGKHLLSQNIKSVIDQTYLNFEIIITDNGSNDGSVKFIKSLQKKDKKVRLLENKNNIGFASGNNKAIKIALREKKSKYIALVNNDVKLEKDWLKNITNGFNKDNIGICTSKILLYYPYQEIILLPSTNTILRSISINNIQYHCLEFRNSFEEKGNLLKLPKKLKAREVYNFAIPYKLNTKNPIGNLNIEFTGERIKIFTGSIRKEIIESGITKIPLKGTFMIQNAGTDFNKKKMTFEDRHIFEFDRALQSEIVDAGCGAAMVIRADLLNQYKSFKDKYFMYYEDCELGFRFQKNCFLTRFINEAVCYHTFWGSSKESITETQTYYGTRNRLWFIREYFGLFKFLYYYIRTFGSMIRWGILIPFKKEARMYFENYLKVIKRVLIN